MDRLKKHENRVNNTINLIRRTLTSRSDDNDTEWYDNQDSIDKIRQLINNSSSEPAKVSSYDLGIKNNDNNDDVVVDYIFISLPINYNNDDSFYDSIERIIKDFFVEAYKNKSNGKSNIIVLVFIVKNLETRAFVETMLKDKEKDIADKVLTEINKELKTHKKRNSLKIQFSYIINQDDCDCPVEINNIDRYLILQEPKVGNKFNFQKLNDEKQKIGYVTTVNLSEIIRLYNMIGDRLFDNNLRYGIAEQIGVNEAICSTLEEDGEQFWYRNNGITILVKDEDFGLNCPNKILFKNADIFSVINGAQTITTASNYYYETRARLEKLKHDKDENEDKIIKKLENTISNINKARVLLRIISIKNEEDAEKDGNIISVALNRQKPIKIEDIAYALDYITDFINLINSNEEQLGNSYFVIKKRDMEKPEKGRMDLVEFARAMSACIGDPISARNKSAASFLKTDYNKKKNKTLFVENKIFHEEINTLDDFKKYYNAVRFAHDLSIEYVEKKSSILYKKYEEESDPVKKKHNILVRNTKWMFISQVIENLNKDRTDDFTDFNYNVKEFDLVAMMKEYFEQIDDLMENANIDLNTFKNNKWFIENKEKVNMDKVIIPKLQFRTN